MRGVDMAMLQRIFDLRGVPYKVEGDTLWMFVGYHTVNFIFDDGRLVSIEVGE